MPNDGSQADRPVAATLALADTHCHLDLDDYDVDRGDAIRRASAVGVGLIINVGFDRATSRASVDLAGRHDTIYASVGLHPHGASDLSDDLLIELERLAANPRVVAIGETGLDYYRDLSPREDQQRAFRAQIELAKRLDLPLVVHNRDALEDVLRIVDEEDAGAVGGVMHCFPGDADYAAEVVGRGFHVGLGGPVTYPKNRRLVEVAAKVPRDRILLETDAPWLPPVPYRGKRNEPAYVVLVAEAVAAARGMDVADLARQTTGNAYRFYRIPEKPEPAIAYEMWGNLYLNITNQCTNACEFCVRYLSDILWGYNLRLEREPSADEIVEAVGDPTRYREIVFCGYGEPTVRLDVVVDVGARLRRAGARVRLDTNGHGALIWNRDVLPDLAEAVDAVVVSLNAQDAETYARICHPRFGAKTFDHVLAFIRRAREAGLDVSASVVDVPGVDVAGTRAVAERLGVPLRVRGTGTHRNRSTDG